MKDYLVLFPETFLWFNKIEGVLYNSNEKRVFRFCCNDLIYSYCMLLSDFKNLYVVQINDDDKQDTLFTSWINHIIKYKIGSMYSSKSTTDKPLSFPPILNLQSEIQDCQVDKSVYYRLINIAECLNEISFFIVGGGISKEEKDFHKQVIYPCHQQLTLSVNEIRSFLENSNLKHLRQINLICADILMYSNYKDLIKLFTNLTFGISITFYLKGHYTASFIQFIGVLKNTSFTLKLYFSKTEDFIKIQKKISNYNIKYNWVFLVKNENDFLLYQSLTHKYHLTQMELFPILTNDNLAFFEDYIFISDDNIENTSLTKQNIFCNQAINSNYWGHLFVLPNGSVYGNLNKKSLGTISEDAMELIKREIYGEDSSWKCTREKITPCKECIYWNLCPPPSNYEFYLNKFNLCKIK